MNIKTLNGDSIIKNIERKYSNYPEGSLSPSEVVIAFPSATEEFAQKLNAELTKDIFTRADEFIKSKVKPNLADQSAYKKTVTSSVSTIAANVYAKFLKSSSKK